MQHRACPKGPAQPAALLAARARGLRAIGPLSEQALWSQIRGGKLGVQFRRQMPLGGRFIADFVAHAARVVVEVDGEYHGRRRQADARRDEGLRRLGYRVVRIEAEQVMRDLPGAVERIRVELRRGLVADQATE